jgi:hypothetical protein
MDWSGLMYILGFVVFIMVTAFVILVIYKTLGVKEPIDFSGNPQI